MTPRGQAPAAGAAAAPSPPSNPKSGGVRFVLLAVARLFCGVGGLGRRPASSIALAAAPRPRPRRLPAPDAESPTDARAAAGELDGDVSRCPARRYAASACGRSTCGVMFLLLRRYLAARRHSHHGRVHGRRWAGERPGPRPARARDRRDAHRHRAHRLARQPPHRVSHRLHVHGQRRRRAHRQHGHDDDGLLASAERRERLPVEYDPQSPLLSRVAGERSSFFGWFILLPLGFAVVGAVIVARGLRSALRVRRSTSMATRSWPR